jgi:hypothetical protein
LGEVTFAAALVAVLTFGSFGSPHGVAASDAPVTVRLAVAGRSNTAPSISADGSLVAVAWHAALAGGGGDVFVAISRDSGSTFDPPVQVNAVAGEARSGGELPPRIVLGPARGGARELAVIWRSRAERTSIRLSRSLDAGRTFAGAVTMEAAGARGERGWHSAAVGSDGRVHTLWLDHRELAPPPGAPPHVHGKHQGATDGVAMAQKSGLYHAAADAGAPAERELVKGVCYCCKTAAAAGRGGRVHAAWRHVYPGNIRDIAFISSFDGGRTFGAPIRVAEDGWQIAGCPDDGPAIAMSPDQQVHVVWPTVIAGPEPRGALFHASSRDGRAFTTRVRIPTLGSPKPSHPQVAVVDDRQLVVVWDEILEGTRRAAVVRATTGAADGVVFGKPAMLDPTGPPSVYPVVASTGPATITAWTSGAGEATAIAVRRLAGAPGSSAP